MFGGIAVAGNLLCVSYTDARGKLFLVDVEDRRLVSHWSFAGPDGGFADAAGVAMDRAYNIFVADTRNDVVRRFSPFGRSAGTLGLAHERSTGSAHRDRVGALDRPHAVAICEGVIHVACGERKLVRGVQRFRPDGRPLTPLAAFGDREARFGAPRGIATSRTHVFVTDTLHGAVQAFRVGGRYSHQFSTARHPGEASRPVAAAILPDGDVLVADHGDEFGLRRFSPGGEHRELGLDPETGLDEPTGLCVDGRGRLYVLDRHGERVSRFDHALRADGLIVDLAEVGFGE